jgi:two-component system, OmpR family, sensor kinase
MTLGAVRRIRRLSDRTPLRVKLVVALLALVTVALVATGVAATTALQGYLVDRIDSQLRSFARDGRGAAEPGYARRGEHGPTPLPSAFYVLMLDDAGRVVGERRAPLAAGGGAPDVSSLTIDVARERAGTPFTVSDRTGDGSHWRVLVTLRPGGTGSRVTALSLDEVDSTVRRLLGILIVVSLGVVVVLAGLAYAVVRSSLRPLEEVEDTAEAIAAGDLSRRVPDHDGRTEVGRLTRALNGMLAQIESAFRSREASEAAARRSEERMRRFVTDASHELRTPLTSIRGFAELYRQGAASAPADVPRLMRRIEDAAARMGLLVEDLLLLARLDQQRPLQRRPVDLVSVATDAVHEARAVEPRHRIDVQVLGGDPAPHGAPPVVLGDDARLRQVAGNLLGNALTHTPEGTPVTVRVGTVSENGHRWAVLEVADRGPGLAPEQADRVFERFYRADSSRARATGGAGLGLSIVSALVAAHGGTVQVHTEPGKGATFRVRLPLERRGDERGTSEEPSATTAPEQRGTSEQHSGT